MSAVAPPAAQLRIEEPTGNGLNPHFTEIPSDSTWVGTLLRYLSYAALALPLAAACALCIYLFFQLSLAIAVITAILVLAGGTVGSVFLYKWLGDWATSSEITSKRGIEWHQVNDRWRAALERNDASQLNDVEKAYFSIPGMDERTIRSNLATYLTLLTWLSFYLRKLEQAVTQQLAADAERPTPNKAVSYEASRFQWISALAFNELRRLFYSPKLHTNAMPEVVVEQGAISSTQGYGILRSGMATTQHLEPLYEIRLPEGPISVRLSDLHVCQLRANGNSPLERAGDILKRVNEMVDSVKPVVQARPAPPRS